MSKFNLNMNAEINPNFNFMSNTGSGSVDIDKYQDNFWTSCQDGSCDYSIGKGQLFDSNRYTYFVCEGSGVQKLSFKDSSQFVATIADNDKFHTDGFNTLDKLQTTSSRFSIKFRNESIVGDFKFERNDFVSSSAPGDSTSAIYVYDSVEKQWYVIGVVSTSDCTASDLTGYPCVQENYALLNNAKIDEFKQSHTTLLNGGNYALSDNGLKDSANKDMGASVIVGNAKGAITFANYYNKGNFNNQNNAMQNSKDLYLQGNGTSSLDSNTDLGTGGLIVDKNAKWSIDSKNSNHWLILGGIFTDTNSQLIYNVKTLKNYFLHKVGSGELVVTTSSPEAGLRIGDGLVSLQNKTNNLSFKEVYFTSGRGVLKIDKASNIDTNHIYFGAGGGNLDINGQNLSFEKIYASDSGAIISNSNSTNATLTLNNTSNYLYHGQIIADKASGGINIESSSQKALAFDDGIDNTNDTFSFSGKAYLSR